MGDDPSVDIKMHRSINREKDAKKNYKLSSHAHINLLTLYPWNFKLHLMSRCNKRGGSWKYLLIILKNTQKQMRMVVPAHLIVEPVYPSPLSNIT
ncbi:MAG: hypothetical protein ABIJ37_00325 [Pseudomonadota bacterium]